MKRSNIIVEWLSLDYAVFGEPVTYSNFSPSFVNEWCTAKTIHLTSKYGENALLEAKKVLKKAKKAKKAVVKKAKKVAKKARNLAKKKIASKKTKIKENAVSIAKGILKEYAINPKEAVDVALNLILTEEVLKLYSRGFFANVLTETAVKELI